MKTRIAIILGLVSIAIFSFSFSSTDTRPKQKLSTAKTQIDNEPVGGFISDEIKR